MNSQEADISFTLPVVLPSPCPSIAPLSSEAISPMHATANVRVGPARRPVHVNAVHSGFIVSYGDLTESSTQEPRHVCPVTSLAVSRDTEWVASGSEDGFIILRKATDPAIYDRWYACSSATGIHALAFSPCSEWLASAHGNGKVKVWAITCDGLLDGRVKFNGLRGAFQCSLRPMCVLAWSPDGERIAAADDDASVYICDWLPPFEIPEFHLLDLLDRAPITVILFSPNSPLLVYGGAGGRCRIWNLKKNESHAELEKEKTQTVLRHAAFDALGTRIVLCFDDDTAHLGNVKDHRVGETSLMEFTLTWQSVRHATFSPHGELLLVALVNGQPFLRKWNLPPHCSAADDIIWHPFPHTNQAKVKSVHFSQNAKFIALAWADGTVGVWETGNVTQQPSSVWEYKDEAVTLVAFGRGGDVLVCATDVGTVRLCRTAVDSRSVAWALLARTPPPVTTLISMNSVGEL